MFAGPAERIAPRLLYHLSRLPPPVAPIKRVEAAMCRQSAGVLERAAALLLSILVFASRARVLADRAATTARWCARGA